MRGGFKVTDKLKHTSHHFVELVLKRYWKSTSQKDERFGCQFLLKVFIKESFLPVFLSVFLGETKTICNLTLYFKNLHNQNRKRESRHVCGHRYRNAISDVTISSLTQGNTETTSPYLCDSNYCIS